MCWRTGIGVWMCVNIEKIDGYEPQNQPLYPPIPTSWISIQPYPKYSRHVPEGSRDTLECVGGLDLEFECVWN